MQDKAQLVGVINGSIKNPKGVSDNGKHKSRANESASSDSSGMDGNEMACSASSDKNIGRICCDGLGRERSDHNTVNASVSNIKESDK